MAQLGLFEEETRLYGVSIGDGNYGTSHMFANYYVRTNKPWLLARAAAYNAHEPEAWDFLDRNLEVDGEAEDVITASLLFNPGVESDEEIDLSCHTAEFLLDVFPDFGTREGRLTYDSLEEALSAEAIARALKD